MRKEKRLRSWVKVTLAIIILGGLFLILNSVLTKMDNDARKYNYSKCGGKANTIEYRDNHGDLMFSCKD